MKNLRLFAGYCLSSPYVLLACICVTSGLTLFLNQCSNLLPGSASYLLPYDRHITIWHWQWQILFTLLILTLFSIWLYLNFKYWKKRAVVMVFYSIVAVTVFTGCERQTAGYISPTCAVASTDTTLYGVDTTGHDGDGKADVFVHCKDNQLHPDSFKCGEIVCLDWDTNGVPFINPTKGEGFVCSDYTGHFCKQCYP